MGGLVCFLEFMSGSGSRAYAVKEDGRKDKGHEQEDKYPDCYRDAELLLVLVAGQAAFL